LFRYIEEVRPTLLIDEADSFVKDNEEMRGILNSGHTKAAAYVIRNVEASASRSDSRLLLASLTIATFTSSISCAMLRDDISDAAPRLMRS
jgi:hypothetical protein